jgi:single-stranded-DNA-specific exonuclease
MEVTVQRRDSQDWQQLPKDWPDCLKKVLAARGVQVEADLTYSLADLPKPELMLGMDQATDLLYQALKQQWKVMIVADFDADGATSCAVLIKGLKAFGLVDIDYLVPNRFVHGYGLTPELLDEIHEQDTPDLIITVDNGIASIPGVECAKSRNIKVLITDHHLPGLQLPDADAIINPNQHGDNFPSKALAGVGVSFYLLLALRTYLREQKWFEQHHFDEPKLTSLLDLVALGTVADVVPLDRLNRTLVNLGLTRIRKGLACTGLNALMQIAGKSQQHFSSVDFSFSVAPRLNAAGRMEDMTMGIALLLSEDMPTALSEAAMLDDINTQRRSVEKEMQQQAYAMLDKMHFEQSKPLGYCLYDESWHQGVVGLIASRVKEKQHRPCIIFAQADNDEVKGSARSITGVHIRDVLAEIDANNPQLINKFGGHAMAAGLTLNKDQLDLFNIEFERVLAKHIQASDLEQVYQSDGEVSDQELTLNMAEMLATAAPWGQGFSEPQFDGVFKVSSIRTVGQEGRHLRLTILSSSQMPITAMAFSMQCPEWLVEGGQAHLCFKLAVNEFRQQRQLQMIVSHIFHP